LSNKPDIEATPKSDPALATPAVPGSALAAPAWEMPRRGDRYFQIRFGRNISIAVIFSLLVHLLLLLTLAPKLFSTGEPHTEEQQTMIVSLAPPSSKSASAEPAPSVSEAMPEPQPMARPAAKPVKPLVKPKAQPRAKPQPDSSTNKIVALERPAPNSISEPINPRIPAPAAPEPAAPTDMMSYVNAARARREAAQGLTARDSMEIAARDNPLSEDDKRSAIIKRNLQDVGTNGIFQIRELRSNTAQFSFKGWKHEYSNARQELVDVEVGSDGDIDRAIVRKMIAIIRRDYSGDFNWESIRLGRTVILSARQEDNAGLEDFLITEFFGSAGIVAR